LLSIQLLSYSQNWVNVTTQYIKNPSFEQFDTCTAVCCTLDECKGWYCPTIGTSDWFHTCANVVSATYPGGVTVPDNTIGGFQEPYHGLGYIGLFPQYEASTGYYTEYAETHLIQLLKPNKLYKLSTV